MRATTRVNVGRETAERTEARTVVSAVKDAAATVLTSSLRTGTVPRRREWRGARVVEGARLESAYTQKVSRVRIPPSPLSRAAPAVAKGMRWE